MSEVGIEVRSRRELEECVDVINGAKGTMLEGQTKHLEVVDVFARYDP